MGKYLIVGLSGTGKTTVAGNLAKRGYTTINMDDYELAISFYRNAETGRYVERPTPPFSQEWLDTHEWVWDESGIRAALQTDETIFLCGDAVNEAEFYPLFDKVFGLYIADSQEVIRRLQAREPERWQNGSPDLEAKLRRQQREVERLERAVAILIDAHQSPEAVVDSILRAIS